MGRSTEMARRSIVAKGILGVLGLVAGCASTPATYECDVDYRHAPMDLTGLLFPAPPALRPLENATATPSHWELSFADWSNLVAWQEQVYRYGLGLRGLLTDVYTRVDLHNAEHQPPATPAEQEPARRWWQVWR